jgi:hypothetical protein
VKESHQQARQTVRFASLLCLFDAVARTNIPLVSFSDFVVSSLVLCGVIHVILEVVFCNFDFSYFLVPLTLPDSLPVEPVMSSTGINRRNGAIKIRLTSKFYCFYFSRNFSTLSTSAYFCTKSDSITLRLQTFLSQSTLNLCDLVSCLCTRRKLPLPSGVKRG